MKKPATIIDRNRVESAVALDDRKPVICSVHDKCHKPGAHQHRVPAELLRRKTGLFCAKVALAFSVVGISSVLMLSNSLPLILIGMFVQGSMYVHMLELQHSALHLHAFKSPKISRIVGFLLGLPMMVSYSYYQYVHMKHHKWLGTQDNSETFTYNDGELGTKLGFLKGMFDYSRLAGVSKNIWKAFAGQNISDAANPMMEERIRQEFRLFGWSLLAAAIVSGILQSVWPLALWLLPLIATEPVHFLMALPDHFGLPAHSNPNVFKNTRTIRGTWFSHWFTNYSTLHMAHHYNQNVPIENIEELQKLIESEVQPETVSQTYPDFFKGVITRRLIADQQDKNSG